MKTFILSIIISFFAASVYANENVVGLKDGKIIVQTQEGTNTLDYSKKDKYSPYSLKKWEVKRESNLINEALDVYKQKSVPVYSEKIWIVNKENEAQQIYVQYQSRDDNERIVFSKDENFGFYLGLSDDGISVVYGLNLLTQETSPIAEADDFSMTTCENTQLSYLVVQRNGKEDTFFIYNLKGDPVKEVTYSGSIDDLNDVICY